MDVYVPPHRYSRAFAEVGETLRCGLRALTDEERGPDRRIVVGPHLLEAGDARGDDIFYNFEQHGSPQLNEATLDLFRQHEVWDYSPSNIKWLAERGIQAKHVPVGYVPELSRIEHAAAQDIDVLFYGLVNDRRRKIIDSLPLKVYVMNGGKERYGVERDAMIRRSKVVLNMHYYDTAIFEIVRCSYLFANAVCVVSEDSVDVPPRLVGAFPLVPYERLVDCCVSLCGSAARRHATAMASHDAFRHYSEVAILRKALAR